MSDPRPAEPGPEAAAAADGTAERSPAFAHASEAELSRILDFYGVRWQYEPHVFPILWNTDGEVLESFAPDFYLPDLDLYVEMTTLRQKLVRKKNRKLRRLRELYPDIRIKLFYGRDFRALMLKYGRLALADELSGTSGQVTPQRPYAELLAGPFGVAAGVGSATVDVQPLEPLVLVPEEVPLAAPVAPIRRRRRRPVVAKRPAGADVKATDR
jgi:hypoxanthine phosphoribosyltransferase